MTDTDFEDLPRRAQKAAFAKMNSDGSSRETSKRVARQKQPKYKPVEVPYDSELDAFLHNNDLRHKHTRNDKIITDDDNYIEFQEAQQQFYESLVEDSDDDGVPDPEDCQPYNPEKQDENQDRWIQDAVGKEGALSRQLDIPEKKDIPITLLRKIKRTDIGETIENPTETGKQEIKVTKLLKRRAVLAHNLKTMD